MSRVGREPIPVPDGVKIKLDGRLVRITGRLGELRHELPDGIDAVVDDGKLQFTRRDDSSGQRSLHGLTRALVANMVKGVTEGFSKELKIVGVGYRCDMLDRALQLIVGFSHKLVFIPPEGIEIKVIEPTRFSVNGINKEIVGDVAAKIRSLKPPEP